MVEIAHLNPNVTDHLIWLNHGLNSKERVEDLWVTYLHLPEVAERKCFCGCV